jgi:hypothetical protein
MVEAATRILGMTPRGYHTLSAVYCRQFHCAIRNINCIDCTRGGVIGFRLFARRVDGMACSIHFREAASLDR